jgi:hypothetical protein
MFERPVERIPLRRPQLLEISFDPLPGRAPALALPPFEVARHLVPGEHGLGDLVEHRPCDYIKAAGSYFSRASQ